MLNEHEEHLLKFFLRHETYHLIQIRINRMSVNVATLNYHLKNLMERKLIEKVGKKYTLTELGREMVLMYDTEYYIKSKVEEYQRLNLKPDIGDIARRLKIAKATVLYYIYKNKMFTKNKKKKENEEK